jgi:hypothetical protein
VAARSVIGTSFNITDQALVTGVDLPARSGSCTWSWSGCGNVWDALQKVDVRICSLFFFFCFYYFIFKNLNLHRLADRVSRVCVVIDEQDGVPSADSALCGYFDMC